MGCGARDEGGGGEGTRHRKARVAARRGAKRVDGQKDHCVGLPTKRVWEKGGVKRPNQTCAHRVIAVGVEVSFSCKKNQPVASDSSLTCV